jgi:hypothetical protein
LAEIEPDPPVFGFEGSWPFTGTPAVSGHPLAAVSSWDVRAAADGIPVVTLTLVGPGALKLLLGSGAARVQVSDETREALESLGWTPPANR